MEKVEDKQSSSVEKEPIPFDAIIDHLNQTVGAHYKATTPKTRELIRARWNEGFRLDDFQRVHIVKKLKWAGTEMAPYLRPITLYGNKFESYLNEKIDERYLSERTKKNLIAGQGWLEGEGNEQGG